MTAIALPQLEFFAELSVEVGQPQEVGRTVHGLRRLIPILGGQASGRGWTARILPGGADYQLIVNDRLAELDARYTMETDAGDLIYVQNRAMRAADPEVTARLLRGEPVDPQLVYFRCSPSFEAAAPAWQWLSERLFLGSGVRRPDRVELQFYTVT